MQCVICGASLPVGHAMFCSVACMEEHQDEVLTEEQDVAERAKAREELD